MDPEIFKTKISFQFYLIKISLFVGIIVSVFLSIKQLPGFVLLIAFFSFLFYFFKVIIVKLYNDRFAIEEIHFPKRFSKKRSFYFNEIKEVKIKQKDFSKSMVIVSLDGDQEEIPISSSVKDLSAAVTFINLGIAGS